MASGPVSFHEGLQYDDRGDQAGRDEKRGQHGGAEGGSSGYHGVYYDQAAFERDGELQSVRGLTKAFMEALDEGRRIFLDQPENEEGGPTAEGERGVFSHGDCRMGERRPGILFLDRINEANPTPSLGEIESTNPCGEVPLLPYEACVLGSINLLHMSREKMEQWEVDFEKLKETVRTAVHFLDNVIDMNQYPMPEIAEMDKRKSEDWPGGNGAGPFLHPSGNSLLFPEGHGSGEGDHEFYSTSGAGAVHGIG